MLCLMIITILKASKSKAFTIWESIIAILILSFCVLSVNTFLLDMAYYVYNLKSIAKISTLTTNVAACFFAYNNEAVCTLIFNKLSNITSNVPNCFFLSTERTLQDQRWFLQKIKIVCQNQEYIIQAVVVQSV